MPRKRQKNWSKKARSKGYRVEYDTVKSFKKQGIFAFKVPNSAQVKEMSKVDVLVIFSGLLIQSKYQKKSMTRRDKELLLYTRSKYPMSNIKCMLSWRKDPTSSRGIKMEELVPLIDISK